MFPSPMIPFVCNLMLTLSVAALLWSMRQYIADFLRAQFGERRTAAKQRLGLSMVGIAAAGSVGLTSVVIGLPKFVALGGAMIACFVVPRILKQRNRQRYCQRFDESLPESLSTISSSIKAGLTLKDSLSVAAQNCQPVFSEQAAMVLKENRFGVPLDEAMDHVRIRVDTANCNIAFGAMMIASKVGGNLPEILMRIAATVRERERVAGKLRSLTAQGRMQALLVCSAPPAIGVGMYWYDPVKMGFMTDTMVGQFLLTLAVILEIVGIVVTRRIMKLEI